MPGEVTIAPQTILLGDLSGLQDFLFDVAAVGGGQARRLRARSLFISLVAEAAALRLLEAVGWSRPHIVFSAAGKFLLAGPSLDAAARHNAERVAAILRAQDHRPVQLAFALAVPFPKL